MNLSAYFFNHNYQAISECVHTVVRYVFHLLTGTQLVIQSIDQALVLYFYTSCG